MIDEMIKQMKEKKLLLGKMVTFIEDAPEGGLKFQRKNGKIYYYQQKKNNETNRWEKIYIKRNRMNLAKELAQKGYLLSIKSVLEKQIHLLEHFINKGLLSAHTIPEEQQDDDWQLQVKKDIDRREKGEGNTETIEFNELQSDEVDIEFIDMNVPDEE